MKSSFGEYGPIGDHYVEEFIKNSPHRPLQVWRGMAQSKRLIDYDKDFYYIDTGYFNNYDGSKHKEWHRITKNNYQVLSTKSPQEIRESVSDEVWFYMLDKFKRIFAQSWTSWHPRVKNPDAENIMIIEPSLKVFTHYGIDGKEWRENVIAEIKQYSDRKIIFREKPTRQERMSTNKLDDQLRTDLIYCTVTFASVAGLHSIMAGTPSIVLGPSAGDVLANKEIKNIENLYYPSFEKIKDHVFYLSQCQFNINEIQDGTAWRMIELLQGNNKYEKHKGLVFTG